MRMIVWVALGGLLCAAGLEGQEAGRKMTKEEALKVCRTLGGRELGQKWFDHGDKTGPYVHAGRIILGRFGGVSYAVVEPDGGLSEVGLDLPDGAEELRMDFFASEGGYGWVTTHYFEPEIESTFPKERKDERPAKHRALGPAAEMAIKEGNLGFLKVLLANGLEVNGPLDFEEGQTALYVSVWERQLEITRFLLGNGADGEIRSRHGDRPIDLAIKWKAEEFCALLAKPESEEEMIDGIPAGVLAEVFSRHDTEEIQFVSVNGKDASPEMLAWLRKQAPNARAASRMETITRRPLGAHSWYRDKTDGGFGSLLQVKLEREEDYWKVWFRDSVGPSMAGGGWEGQMSKAHGYWHRTTGSSWAE